MARDPANAGALRERVRFEQRDFDANGVRMGDWVLYFECAARIEVQPGALRVAAQRLEGEQPIVITVRANPVTRAITSDMQAIWLRPDTAYLVKPPQPTEDRAWVEIWATAPSGGIGG